jgi:general secretion pathway protein A
LSHDKPPAIDDPNFLASLSDLDRGLVNTPAQEATSPQSRSPAPPRPSGSPQPARPSSQSAAPPDVPSIFPDWALLPPAPRTSRFTRGAAIAEAAAAAPSETDPSPALEGPRPLLDLFPPPAVRTRARPPAFTGAPPPRLPRGRFTPAGHDETSSDPDEAPLDYEAYYGLEHRAFSLSTDPKFFFHSAPHDRASEELIDAIGRRCGLMLLTGEPGTGKTTLCRSLADRLGRRTVTSVIVDRIDSFGDLMRRVLVDFGVVARDEASGDRLAIATRKELVAAVGDFAASLESLEATAVIIIDGAEHRPAHVLDPLLALVDDEDESRRVQVILAGEPAFESMLRRPEFRAIGKRVAVRCRLDPLTAEETIGYVTHRLAVAGSSARVEFSDAALTEVHAATGGFPRLINLVCDRALARGCEVSATVIDAPIVAAAAAGLELTLPQGGSGARKAALALLFLALMLLGAAAAAWVFRAEVEQLVDEWRRGPLAPAAPLPQLPPTAAPPPPPE